ncbi:MAG: NADH-quinone oxidoreductase subunit L [candidate division Zixibacteria bacterium RBG_16_40_9]|nr:MAG: NADH-quinone oxidoreductase subunit L [candidate division Zixibacteria bacterium RBG_16_40_9]
MFDYIILIPLFPLIGFLLNGLVGKKLGKSFVSWIGPGTVGLSFALALKLFLDLLSLPAEQRVIEQIAFPWVISGDLQVNIAFLLDPLSAVMMLVVCGVGFLIHVYSIGYMHEDPGYARYFSFLNLFEFSMLVLVLANNFLLMFLGWEGVGLCSYLLIGFWFEKKSAADAGKKAFIVNRIGDFGFMLGMILIFVTFGSLNFIEVFKVAPEYLQVGSGLAVAITLLLFAGAVGKSAQIPLYVWLPDAMEGPTPVSALIHAATMVTAGVYMVARCHVLYLLAPFSLSVVAVIGAITAFYAASIGLVQNDIKRVLAYSTISQIGYMFLACGVGAFAAGIFHLMTHAFFKALLFLGAGAVIHALAGEQDLRKMGGLKSYLPATFITFLIATLAISGIPLFSGFFSKDEILWKAYSQGNPILWLIGFMAAGFTAFYMFRLFFLTFYGKPQFDVHRAHPHEAPYSMRIPLIILGVLSAIGGYIGLPQSLGGKNWFEKFLAPVFAGETHLGSQVQSHFAEYFLMILSIAIAFIGLMVAFRFYVKNPAVAEKIKVKFRKTYQVLLNKYYLDEFYGKVLVQPFINLALFFWRFIDVEIVDGLANGSANFVGWCSKVFRKVQTGYFRNYALSLALGVVIILTYILLK